MEKIIAFGKQLYDRIIYADVFGLSAQVAYFLLLSLFPFLLFLVTLIGYLPIDDRVIMELLGAYLPNEVVQLIDSNISQLVNNQSGSLLSVGIIGTLWSASNGINAIKRAFNRAYDVEEDRTFIVARLISVGLTVAMIAVISMALLLPVFGKAIGVFVFSLINLSDTFLSLWNTLRWVVSSVILFIVLYALYTLAPNKRIQWNHALWGAIFATIGWQIVSLGFSFYVNTLGNYSATYGSLGTVIILMFWFYLSGIIIITGGVINAVLLKRDKEE